MILAMLAVWTWAVFIPALVRLILAAIQLSCWIQWINSSMLVLICRSPTTRTGIALVARSWPVGPVLQTQLDWAEVTSRSEKLGLAGSVLYWLELTETWYGALVPLWRIA